MVRGTHTACRAWLKMHKFGLFSSSEWKSSTWAFSDGIFSDSFHILIWVLILINLIQIDNLDGLKLRYLKFKVYNLDLSDLNTIIYHLHLRLELSKKRHSYYSFLFKDINTSYCCVFRPANGCLNRLSDGKTTFSVTYGTK